MNRYLVCIAVGILIAGHAVCVFHVLPPRLLTSGELPMMGDVSRYFASAHSSVSAGGLAGYDPYVMAGYLAGGWNSMGKKGYELLHRLLPGVPLPLLMSWILFLVLLVTPLLLAWAVFRLGGRQGLLLPLGVCLAYWHLETQTGTFLQCGNVGYPLAAALVPVAVAMMVLLKGQRLPWLAGLGLGCVAGVVFYCHPVVMVPLGISGLVFAAFHLREFSRMRVWLGLGLALALCVVLSYPWLHVLMATRDTYQPLLYEGFMGSFKHLVMDVFSDRAYRHHLDRNVFLQLAVVGGIAGTWLAWRQREPAARSLMACTCAGVICLALAYLSHVVAALRPWQPYRFLVPAMFLLLPALCRALAEIAPIVRKAAWPVRTMVLALGILVMPRFSGHLIDFLADRPSLEVPSRDQQMLAYLKDARVNGRVVVDAPHLGHLVPYFTGKAVLGGLNEMAFIKEGFAGVDEKGRLFGKFAAEWTPARLVAYLDAYAVECLVLSRPDWVALANSDPGLFVKEATVGPYHVFRRMPWSGYAMDEGAEVTWNAQGIHVRGLPERLYVLKFHYASFLKVSQGASLMPIRVLDDPVSFIGVRMPKGRNECWIQFLVP